MKIDFDHKSIISFVGMNSMRAVGRFPAFESSVPSGPSGLTTDQVDRATETANVSRMDLTKKKKIAPIEWIALHMSRE